MSGLSAKQVGTTSLRILCWNLRAPAEDRVRRQLAWLFDQPANLFVLTECRAGRALQHLVAFCAEVDMHVIWRPPQGREYTTVIVSRSAVTPTSFAQEIDYLPSRVVSVTTATYHGSIEVIGLYVPSRGFDRADRADRKRRFLDHLLHKIDATSAARRRIVCGDLNVLEPDHTPRHRHVQAWESGFYEQLGQRGYTDAFRHLHPDAVDHSWIGRGGAGYRYDHCFVSEDLTRRIRSCRYLHVPRERGLSDHAAMELELALS